MKDWKKIKDKEVVVGLIIIIILGAIALSLLIRREVQHQKNEPILMEENDKMADGSPEQRIEVVAEKTAQIVTQDTSDKASFKLNKEVSLYDILGNEKYSPCFLTERKQDDGQLKELFELA